MTDFDFGDEGGGGSGLFDRIRALLPLLFIMMLLSGMGAFFATQVLPKIQSYTALSEALDMARSDLEAKNSVEPDTGETDLLLAQLDSIERDLIDVAGIFLTSEQADALVDTLYAYADASGVIISNLQAQQSAAEEVETHEMRIFRLQIEGDMPDLLDYMIRLREASSPSVTLKNLSISGSRSDATLMTFDLWMYVSPYADGGALDELPAPAVAEKPAVEPLAPATTIAADPAAEVTASPDDVFAKVPLVGSDMEAQPGECPEAPQPLFAVGEVVVVDVGGQGGLNILSQARTGLDAVEVRAVARDDASLRLLDGPACGSWQSQDIWYWFVDFNGIRGWAGEATLTDRFLCPAANPNCSS